MFARCAVHARPGTAVRRVGVVGSGCIAALVVGLLPRVFGGGQPLELEVMSRQEADTVMSQTPLGRAVDETSFGSVKVVKGAESLAACDVVFTATPATQPVLTGVAPNGIVVALGADSEGKRELGAGVLQAASLVVCDSIDQCTAFGEAAHATRENLLSAESLVEAGSWLADPGFKTPDSGVLVFDLTGIAAQDVAIAAAARAKLPAPAPLAKRPKMTRE